MSQMGRYRHQTADSSFSFTAIRSTGNKKEKRIRPQATVFTSSEITIVLPIATKVNTFCGSAITSLHRVTPRGPTQKHVLCDMMLTPTSPS